MPICKEEGCKTKVPHGNCAKHREFVECILPGCPNRVYAYNLCKWCLLAMEPRTCTIWWCPEPLYSKGVCWSHYNKLRRSNATDRAKKLARQFMKEMLVNSKELAKKLGSKEPDVIMDGLAEIIELQTERLAELMDREGEPGDIKAIDRLASTIFSEAVNLAKLRDPKLSGQDSRHLHVHLRGQPKELAAQAVAALERQGYRREDITDEMIMEHLQGSEVVDKPKAIHAASSST